MSVRVATPCRLHFGLMNAGNVSDVPRFGGLGLMIDAPDIAVSVEAAMEWSADGPSAIRALTVAKLVTHTPHHITVENCPPEHVGLGVGTALALAVAKALRPDLPTLELAKLTGRGVRSGIGLHGFDLGGFIVDGGKQDGELPELLTRLPFPADWRIVLARPSIAPEWHGETERTAFARAPQKHHDEMLDTRRRVEELVRTGTDFAGFATALHEYNRQAGLWFEAVQGGVYAGLAVTAVVERIQKLGIVGVGQSSWGPTVFAFVEGVDRAEWLAKRLRVVDATLTISTTTAANRGARIG